jgi:hypothetical protein
MHFFLALPSGLGVFFRSHATTALESLHCDNNSPSSNGNATTTVELVRPAVLDHTAPLLVWLEE